MAQALWQRRKEEKPADTAPLFPSTKGGHLDASNVFARVFKPAARAAGIPWASFHSLRHTCATLLFRHGLNAKQVQVWLGHHSPAFTLATYIHLLSDDLPDPAFLDELTATPTDELIGEEFAPPAASSAAVRRAQRCADGVPMAAAATRDLTNRQPLHQPHPANLGPLLHADPPLLLTSVEDDRASVETTPDEAEMIQFSTGVGGPVFSWR